MKKTSVFKALALGCTMAAAIAASGSAHAGVIGYELSINDPIFNSESGNNNVPDLQLENISDVSTGAQITDFTLTIGDTDFAFDFVRIESVFADTGASLIATRNSPDNVNDNVGPDEVDYDFTGFDATDIFRFEVDVDKDTGEFSQDYRAVLFPDALLTVSFSNGIVLSQSLNPNSISEDSYLFSQSVEVSEPATLALFGGFVLAGAALRRRAR